MKNFGELLSSQRKKKKISLDKAALDLVIKKRYLEALETEQWEKLPEPTFARGYIKSYAQYIDLDSGYLLALYRREFDESKLPKKTSFREEKRLFFTPTKFINLVFIIAVITFITYIIVQYSSIFSSPKLEIISPKEDETTALPIVQIAGKTEKDATVSVNGQFLPVDDKGNFNGEYKLTDGKNYIEIITSFRLSPKNKMHRTVRLIK